MAATTRTRPRNPLGHRVVTTTLVTALAGLGLMTPAAGATETVRDPLRQQADAIQRTGTVGVVARSTGPHGSRYATAGVADRRTGRAVHPRDKFRIASATKTFVSTVVLQLVGEGRLSLDDTVEALLPGVVTGNGNDGSRITVRQLLNHTSGLFNYTADFPAFTDAAAFRAGRFDTWTDSRLVAIAMRHAPNFEPGTRWEYSNTNYTLAGMIIEKTTGHSWQREVTRRIIRPLDLRDTSAPVTHPAIPGRHLRGYSAFGGDRPIDVTLLNPSGAGAAGGMISTTADLTRFYSALMRGRLLAPAELTEMKTTVRAEELDVVWPGARYGLGLMRVDLTCGGSYYSHAGDIPGYMTRNGFSEDGRHAVVVGVTGDGSAPDLATMEVTNTLIDEQLCATKLR
ncbi:serine hydrolase domain-containing protein [Streptomyces viridosporus]|uniref:serine hydrolase domain-containing protein n=1 Tax=Streptomyces viridosporus TaxID=67581 RepID=UPI0009BDCCAD|nr:serine hydrolase domain-containing protein [Streptomyces viridosporus]